MALSNVHSVHSLAWQYTSSRKVAPSMTTSTVTLHGVALSQLASAVGAHWPGLLDVRSTALVHVHPWERECTYWWKARNTIILQARWPGLLDVRSTVGQQRIPEAQPILKYYVFLCSPDIVTCVNLCTSMSSSYSIYIIHVCVCIHSALTL